MPREFTAVFKKIPEGYLGFVEELPGANTQGATLAEVQASPGPGGSTSAMSLSLKRWNWISVGFGHSQG